MSKICCFYSIGKDSSVLLHLFKKAFYPFSVPISFLHIDTGYKFKEMYDFKKNIELNDGYTVDVDYKSVNGRNLLYTGGKTKIYKNNELIDEYTNIIRGDVNGNATIDIIDYIRIMKHIMEELNLSFRDIKKLDLQ